MTHQIHSRQHPVARFFRAMARQFLGQRGVARRSPGLPRMLEQLEDRRLLSTLSVVSAGVPVDNVSTFGSLQAALSHPGLTSGDIIQIEPGSAPGNVTSSGPGVPNLTIQGDPAATLAEIPMFTLSTTFTAAPGQDVFTLKHANIALISVGAGASNNGSLVLTAATTITGCTLVDVNSTSTIPITLNGANGTLTGTTIINNTPVSDVVVDVATPAGGSSNLIANNTFLSNAGANAVLAYFNGTGANVTDRVINNNFISIPGASVNFFVVVQESVNGLTIQNNSFSGPDAQVGLTQLGSAPQNLQIVGNSFNLGAASAFAMELVGAGPGTTLSGTIANNQFDTHGTGTGIYIHAGGTITSLLNLKIQGNDLHDNKIGITVTGATGPVSGIDLGGGTLGSLGGNDFRGFTAAATPTSGAVVVTGVANAQGIVHAQRNMFATGVTPATVVSDPSANLDLANPLSANAAFVQTLFQDFQMTTVDTTSATGAGKLVTALNNHTLTRAQVVTRVARSKQALGVLVDSLFAKVFGRASDAKGRSNFVKLLSRGGTIEQVVSSMLASKEYKAMTGSDGAFVQSLFTRLLGRTGKNAEVAALAANKGGRAGMANKLLTSKEFRGLAVQQFFGNPLAAPISLLSSLPDLLHRTAPPSASEANKFVRSRQDLLSIELSMAGSNEFFANG